MYPIKVYVPVYLLMKKIYNIMLLQKQLMERMGTFILQVARPGTSLPCLTGDVQFRFGLFTKFRMKKDGFRCVECSKKASELHRDYSNGILKITICVSLASEWVMLRYARANLLPVTQKVTIRFVTAICLLFKNKLVDYIWFIIASLYNA